MSRWRRKEFGLAIGADDIAVLASKPTGEARVVARLPLADYLGDAHSLDTAQWEPPLAAALAQLEENRGDLDATLADEWARYWVVTPPQGLSSLDELRAMAAARFESLYGGSSETWTIEADWQLNSSFLACAIPAGLAASLRAVSHRQGQRLRSVAPKAIRLLNRHAVEFGSDAWVCAFSSFGFLAVLLSAGSIKFARQFRFELRPDADEVFVRLETEALRSGSDMPDHIYFVGSAPQVPAGFKRGGKSVTLLGKAAAMRDEAIARRGPETEAIRLTGFGGNS